MQTTQKQSSSKGGCRSGTEIFADVLRQIEGASLGMSLNSLMLKDKIPEMKNIKCCLPTNQSRQKANWCCLKADTCREITISLGHTLVQK
jgi:hypothetical protein